MFNLVAINLRSVSDKYSKRRLAGSTITTVVSLSLVLFMLGLLGIIILNANQLSNHIKENIGFQIILNDNAKKQKKKKKNKQKLKNIDIF